MEVNILENQAKANPNCFFGRSYMPKIEWSSNWKYLKLNFFEGTNGRFRLYVSKFVGKRLHFYLGIGRIITLDTAHVGKRICGRLNLTGLFGRDFHVYTGGNSEQFYKG